MYNNLIKNKELYSLQTPNTIVPSPSENDYDYGSIDRYFAQRANDSNGFVYEVDENEYNDLLENPYWTVARMRWRISGPIDVVYGPNGKLTDMGVKASNSASIAIISLKIKNISLYLPNLKQFHKS